MNKTDLINVVACTAELTKKDAEVAVNAALSGIVNALKAGEKVQLKDFGSFEVKERAARDGINPLTKEKIKIAASKAVGFSAASAVKEALN